MPTATSRHWHETAATPADSGSQFRIPIDTRDKAVIRR
jgi:hypothetical protein